MKNTPKNPEGPFTLTHNQFEFGDSPGGQILHNTFVANTAMGILWRGAPCENIAIKYNTFNWHHDQLLNINQPLDILRNRCVIDYNNYGTTFLRPEGQDVNLPKPFSYLPSNRDFQIYHDTTPGNTNKYDVSTLKKWQEISGQDKHSLFADPKFIDPAAGRLDVAADSPNLLPDGQIVGALGYLGEHPNLAPDVIVMSPYFGEDVKGGMSVTADASDYDGTVKNVEFYADEKRIGQSATPPYRISGVQLTPGRHVIMAKAVDDRGATAVSDAVEMSVR